MGKSFFPDAVNLFLNFGVRADAQPEPDKPLQTPMQSVEW